ncbi:MAG: hypothetical protein Q8P63_02240, partial [Candidatus Nealsonbacteria bacterium]|nr:hypothetical protein [Candidatus Nealsonbacteria bacterium]
MNSEKKKNKRKTRKKLVEVKPGYISLTEAAKNSPYSQEYLSLLARQGKIAAKKFGRNWYITQEALEEYLTDHGIKIVLPKYLFDSSYKYRAPRQRREGEIKDENEVFIARGKIRKLFNFSQPDFQEGKALLANSVPFGDKDFSPESNEDEEKKAEHPEIEPIRAEGREKPDLVLSEIKEKDQQKKQVQFQMVRTMQGDVLKLGGAKKEKYLFFRKLFNPLKNFPSFINKKSKALKEKAKIFLPKEKIIVSKKEEALEEKAFIAEIKEEAQLPKEVKEKEEILLLAKEIPEKETIKEKSEKSVKPEKPIEERVLERLLQAIEARMPPLGVTAKISQINSAANQYFHSSSKAILVSVAAFIIFLLLVGGISFGNLDKAVLALQQFFKDATTLQGYRPGTHANEVLLLDKSGNISIYGHIETKGQLRSWVQQGVAPFVVDSTTTVENLSADYLDNLSSRDFTLAFVTKNGNITYEDVKLEGKVEVGKELLIRGAAKLLDNLFVYGDLGVFGDAEIQGLTKALGGIETRGADLNLGSGTIITSNRNLIVNLNADMIDSMNASDFDLHFVTSNGNNTFNDISVGGLNVSGFLGQYASFRLGGGGNNVGLIDTKNWSVSATGHISTLGSIGVGQTLGVKGVVTFQDALNVEGNTTLGSALSVAGNSTFSGATTFSGNVVLSSPANLTLNAGDLTVNALSIPSNVSAQATTSGTLSADTYYYVVTALNSNGETSSSTEVSATADGSTTTAVAISWDGITGATSYRVYGRTQQTEDQYWETAVTSYTDTGATGTTAVVPAANTTGGSGTFYSGLTVLGTTVSRSILPETPSYYSLGSPASSWLNVYVDNINATNTEFSGNIQMTDDKWIGFSSTTGRLVFDDQTPDYLTIQNARFGIATTSPRYDLDVWGRVALGTTSDSNTPLLFVDSYNGYIGISTSSPSHELGIQGNIYVSGLIYGNLAEGGIAGGWVDDGAVVRLASTTDNVGIGTDNPSDKLTVWGGDIAVSTDGTATTTITSGISNFAGGFISNASSTILGNFRVEGDATTTGNFAAGGALYIDQSTGYVGIASTTPSDTFAVQGNIIISGTLNTGQGATEVYLMNQPVQTTDSVTFADLALTYGMSAATSTIGELTVTYGISSVTSTYSGLATFQQGFISQSSSTQEGNFNIMGDATTTGNFAAGGKLY